MAQTLEEYGSLISLGILPNHGMIFSVQFPKIYRRKLLKVALATPLAFSVALVLDIQPSLSFLGPLFVFNTIWLFPDPIGLKRVILLKLITLLIPMWLAAAFVSGLWELNSIVIFLFILLTGWGLQTWMPSAISLGILPVGMFLAATVLNSSAPYTTAVYMFLLMTVGMGLGWLAERLFWSIFDQQGIERQVSKTFQLFQDLSARAFQRAALSADGGDGSLEALTAQAKGGMRTTNKALKTAAMTNSLSPSERDIWVQALALQERLLFHLLAISGLIQENRENPLLHELATELSALGNTLSATFAGLSVAIVSPHPGIQLPNPKIDFQHWQTRLKGMREAGKTQSYNLASRMVVGLIEHRLDRLSTEVSKSLTSLETRRSNVPVDLLLKPTLKYVDPMNVNRYILKLGFAGALTYAIGNAIHTRNMTYMLYGSILCMHMDFVKKINQKMVKDFP